MVALIKVQLTGLAWFRMEEEKKKKKSPRDDG
jgi:hypothetical protein